MKKNNKIEDKEIKLGIFGSRTLTDKQSIEIIKRNIKEFIASHKVSCLIIPGDIKGACAVAIDVARETLIPVMLFFYKKGTIEGGRWEMIRSIKERKHKIINKSDFFLIFHDGISKGTKWDMKQIIKAGKQYEYIKVEKKDEINRDIDEDINIINIEDIIEDIDINNF